MEAQGIINKLIEKRRSLGYTQMDLATQSQISRRTIATLESGATEISLNRLLRIIAALDLQLTIEPRASRPTESQLSSLFNDD